MDVFYLDGRLDIAHLQEVENQINQQIEQGGTRYVICDLSRLDYMSSSGLRMLITLMRRLNDQGGWLKLSGLRPQVEKIFEAASVKSVFDIYPTDEAALGSV